MINKFKPLIICLSLLLTTWQTASAQELPIDTTNSFDLVFIAFQLQKCDSISKEKDNAIAGLKSTLDYRNEQITDAQSQIDLMNEKNKFTSDQILGLTNRLTHSERKVVGLKIGCVSVGILGLLSTGYFIVH